MIRILTDENIPCAEEIFGEAGQVSTRPGRTIVPEDVREADVLLVRSVTRVNEELLDGSDVQFVGSATAGTDHVDRDFLERADIAFAHAPGANAGSVVEWVLAALLTLSVRTGQPLTGMAVGIVGVGRIGGRLAERLPALGVDVLLNDPPLQAAAEAEAQAHAFVSLHELLRRADVVTLHTPLTRTAPHATHHLIGAGELATMPHGTWLLNACRGPVVDNRALRAALEDDRLTAALDVWEGEPTPDADLVRRCALATPHIAGYSYDGKVAGTLMLYRAAADALGLPPLWDEAVPFAPSDEDRLTLRPPDPARPADDYLHALTRQLYDIAADDVRLRATLELPLEERGAAFQHLRKTYPRRRAWERHTLAEHVLPDVHRRGVRAALRVGQATSASLP